ncbi:MAG: FtsX-like permease family protein [Cyclobacteriaceae bacterium]|nr:FtsX-like permease family protein [Cyclobacteriaceae bacterium]
MIRNYLKTAFRSIFRNKLTAFINIAGLALAMSCALMIYLYVSDETGYDRYSEKSDRTYRITRDFLSQDGSTNLKLGNVAPPIGPLVKNDFGEIETMARAINFRFVLGIEENGEQTKVFTEEKLFVVEPDIFKIFDIEVIAGDPKTALEKPFSIMLTEEAAEKYFGNENAVGKHLIGSNKYELEVTGIYKSFPTQSHWHPEMMVSFSTLNDSLVYGRKRLETNWGNNAFGTYVVLEEGADPEKLEAQMPAFLNKHFGPYAIRVFGAPPTFDASKTTKLHVEKVKDIHLLSHRDDELEANGSMNNVYIMGVIGLFIILIACFNFVNLSTARASTRAKEVGLRKAVGAYKNQLINQYLSESILISFLAMALSLVFSSIAIGWLNDFTDKELSLNLIQNWKIYAGLIAFTTFVGVLAGIYPAFVISSYNPALVLKGQSGSTKGRGEIRKVLVVAQFVISTFLIISTAVIFQQLGFLNASDLGYDKDQVITLRAYNDVAENFDSFYNELTKSSHVKNVGRSTLIPTNRLLNSNGTASIVKGNSLVSTQVETKMVYTDPEFFKTFGVQFVAGRDFDKAIRTDDTSAFVINETAAREYGWNNPEDGINKDFNYGNRKGKLIGVVKDFHFESLHQRIIPIVFFQVKSDNYYNLSIKISHENFQEGIAHVEKVWKEFLPKRPFEYDFLSDRYNYLYESEQKQSQLFTIFSGLAIFIACLGLFGLATFNTLQRIKEIGIRKVLGASVPNILTLLSKEIVILILIANVIAWPLAWIFMGRWLNGFAYHIDMNIAIYALAAILAIVLALVTVSIQTVKAAMTNPANTLHHE